MKFCGLFPLFFLPFSLSAQCSGSEPVIDLGSDTILCSGQSVQLTVPAGYDTYTWSTGSTGTSITAASSGMYVVEATLVFGNQNLVVNGDFESGNSGFSSSYNPVNFVSPTALWDPGYYAIGNSPNDYHSNFYTCTDHSSGSGKMYIANGSSSPNTTIWSQTISVQANTNYNFTAWVASVENTSVPAVLQFFVNGSQIGDVFSPSSTGCSWDQFYNLWNSGSNTSAVISIVNQNTEASGNDFALDDISFIPYCTNRDTVNITVESITVNAGSDVSICADSNASLQAVANVPGSTFLWSNGQSGTTITPGSSGIYSVSATTPNGCSDSDEVELTINPLPDAGFSTSATEIQVPQTLVFEAPDNPAN